jgi:hypothetical protein
MHGGDGTRIRESGLAVRISISDSASGLAGTAVMAGAGITGGSTGAADMECTAAAGTTLAAIRFITGTATTEEGAKGA